MHNRPIKELKAMKIKHPSPVALIKKFSVFALAVFMMVGVLSALPGNAAIKGIASAACLATAPPTTYGQVTQSVNVTTAGTYRVWSRIKAPDTTANSYYFQVDNGCAYNVGDSASIPANTWTWVNYQDGTTSSTVDVTLTAGSHTLTYTGKEANVQLDKVLLLTDTACVPTNLGDNCATSDTTPPTVSVTSPTGGSTVSGTVNIAATAADASGITQVQFLVDGTAQTPPDTTAAYTYSWDTTQVTNGAHTIQAKATDTAGNTATSAAVSVTVNNVAAGQPDLVVTDVTWAPASPASGNQVTFTATIKNQGTAATAAGTIVGVSFTVDGTQVNWSDNNTTSLAAGASRTQTANGGPTGTATWTASGTTHTVAANVDDVNRITESNEANNTFSKSLTIGAAVDTTPPTVSITAPTTGSSITAGTVVNINATASDNVGVTKVDFLVDGTLKTTVTQPGPYTYPWNTTGVTSGTHTLTTKAYDAAGNSTTSSAVSVTVGTQTVGSGDVNGDGRVNALDLSALISHDGQNYPAADFNHDGTVGAADMAILLAKWTW
jgi:hypothetical protein